MKYIRKIWSASWRILVLFGGWAGLIAVLVVPVLSRHATHGVALAPGLRLYVETVSLLSVLGAVWLMLRFVDCRPFLSLGFGANHAWQDWIIGLAIGFTMLALVVSALIIFGWANWSNAAGLSASAVNTGTLAILLNTVTQEVLVRGYVQQTIQLRFGGVPGILISSLFFLALHLGAIGGQLLPAVSLFAAGVLLGTAYAVSGQLWLPIALHFAWNALQGPILGGAVSGQKLDTGPRLIEITGPPLMTGGAFGLEGGLVAIAITILATPAVFILYRRRRLSMQPSANKKQARTTPQ